MRFHYRFPGPKFFAAEWFSKVRHEIGSKVYLQNEQVRENLKYARNHHKRYKYRKYSKLNTTNLLAIFSNGNCTTATHFKLFQFLRITFVLFILDVKCQTIPVYRTTSFYSKVTFTKPICLFLFCFLSALFSNYLNGDNMAFNLKI